MSLVKHHHYYININKSNPSIIYQVNHNHQLVCSEVIKLSMVWVAFHHLL